MTLALLIVMIVVMMAAAWAVGFGLASAKEAMNDGAIGTAFGWVGLLLVLPIPVLLWLGWVFAELIAKELL